MQRNSKRYGRILTPALLAASAATAFAGAVDIAANAPVSARIGDILAFAPGTPQGPERDTRIVVHRPGQFGCVLDLATIRQGGGSMVLEARLGAEGNRYRLHWAGERTTTDSGDCGRSADLIVDHRDLATLASAANADRWQRAGGELMGFAHD